MKYIDTGRKNKETNNWAFMIEPENLMAERHNALPLKTDNISGKQTDSFLTDIVGIFQYMIGNTDWSISKLHNVKLIALENGTIIPVPYDFDYSGFVDTKYSVPNEELGLSNVTERLFRGYCRIPGSYENSIEIFNAHKEDIYSEISDLELLDEKHKKPLIKYMDDFYKIVNDPKLLKRKIYDACELQHKHMHYQ